MTSSRTGAARAQPRGPAPSRSRARPVSTKARPRKTDPARSASRGARHRRRSSPRAAAPPRHRRFPFLVASFVIVGVLVVGVTSLQAVVSQGSFRMQELTRHNLQLQQDFGRLKLQVAELSSPGRIASQARRLGFHLPQPDEVRSLPVKGTVPLDRGAGTAGRLALSLKNVLERDP